ncbi:DUF4037 domain-containing protein [Streptomyces sp. A7024]|uniref:DUF4037 domain-containing protein n=1 Tax=Streptomyces coryli TaxID=1128680 RepID=A0A6G4UBY6_9ACTN|nr:DUF4037 domain-containing protein [Streptomyces coryli]NGN69745.1 DUF4037 domain-containing protein [Streptomyces coryli]
MISTPGLDLARRFYADAVAPLVAETGVPHAAALLGSGSEVLGFDDVVSTDHNFGPRLQLFLPEGSDPAPVEAALHKLPQEFGGYPVRYAQADVPGAQPRHHVEIVAAPEFFRREIALDPADGMRLADWLLTPTQKLAALTAGAVFADPDGELSRRRAALRWYPDDVWRYVLAAAWLKVAQEEAFVGRTGGVGDECGSAVVGGRLVRELMRLAFLVERRWAPYNKWLGTAFARLPLAARVGPHLDAALTARGWRDREAAVCAAAAELAAATNALGLAPEVDPAPRQFFGRDVRVLDAGRFVPALTGAVTDPAVRAHTERQGRRHDTVGSLTGAIDQVVDSTDVLSSPRRCRAAAALLELGDCGQELS